MAKLLATSSPASRIRANLLQLKARLFDLQPKAGFNPAQPRVPRGNPTGGRWTDGGAGFGTQRDAPEVGTTDQVVRDKTGEKPWKYYVESRRSDGSLLARTVHNRDGSRILIETFPQSVRSTVTLGDRLPVIFEQTGDIQRVFDSTGELIAESVWTPDGPVIHPILQPAFLDDSRLGKRPISKPATVILDAAVELYNWWLSTQEPGEDVVFAFRADELMPVSETEPPLWTSGVARETVEEACPRFPLVQDMTNKTAAALNRGQYKNPGAYGTAVHMGVKSKIDALHDPSLTTEVSILKSNVDASRYGAKETVRIDIIEDRGDGTVCVYDLKTGRAFLSRARLFEIYDNVLRKHQASRIIVVEVRPAK
jgi:hypothetical protein